MEKAAQHRRDTNTVTWCLPDSPANEAQLRSALLNFFCHGPLFQHCTGESLKRKQSHCNTNPETRQNLCDGVRWYRAAVVQRLWRRRLTPETRVRSPVATHLLASLNLPVASLAHESTWNPVTLVAEDGLEARTGGRAPGRRMV